jgi:hypothetical protein
MTTAPDVFDEVVILADARLGTDAADDILRASLLAGAGCARSMVTRIPSLRDGWTEENRVGAVLLTEFWSGVLASRLLGAIADRDQVVDQVTAMLADRLFGSSRAALRWSLATFEEQLSLATEADLQAPQPPALDRAMAWFFLYWRSRDLLVGDLPLQGRFHAARTLDAWLADPRHADLVPPPDHDGAVLTREITLWGLESASGHYQSLRRMAEQADERDTAASDEA